MFFGTYFVLLLVGLTLPINAWKVINGPSTEIAPALSNYENFLMRQKIRNAIEQVERQVEREQNQHENVTPPSETQLSAISKGELYKIVRAMRTRMFGSI